MSKLTASYINYKLAAKGTTNKTKDLILEFLNTAPSASAIAVNEPMKGLVFDDPEEVCALHCWRAGRGSNDRGNQLQTGIIKSHIQIIC
jgi:hypothetical protein